MIRLGPRDYEALGVLFAQEINRATQPATAPKLAWIARLPKARTARLEAMGLAECSGRAVGADCLGPIRVPVWELTAAGHFAYCQWAAEQPDAD